MHLVDSHCHIQDLLLDDPKNLTVKLWKDAKVSLDKVIQESLDQGVREMIVVGCNLEESKAATSLAREYSFIYASIGKHPHEADQFVNLSWKKEFERLLQDPKVVAIGEIGLDYFYNYSQKENQIKILKEQLELGQKHSKPFIFHIRKSFEDFWPIFKQFDQKKKIRAVLHSYTDSLENLEIALESNLYIGVNGIATFAKDKTLANVYKKIPKNNLLLETDSPYLTPVPFRGSINTPKNTKEIAIFLANLRGEEIANLADYTTENSHKLFGF